MARPDADNRDLPEPLLGQIGVGAHAEIGAGHRLNCRGSSAPRRPRAPAGPARRSSSRRCRSASSARPYGGMRRRRNDVPGLRLARERHHRQIVIRGVRPAEGGRPSRLDPACSATRPGFTSSRTIVTRAGWEVGKPCAWANANGGRSTREREEGAANRIHWIPGGWRPGQTITKPTIWRIVTSKE
jgi:hypothetical protein